MAKKTVNIGTSVNKGDGDPLRTAFGKINDNFDEIYGAIGSDGSIFNPLNVDSHLLPDGDNTRDLGSPDKRWRDIFVAPGSLYIGDLKLSNDNGTLLVQQVTDAGLVTETPVGGPGSVTTDRLVNGENEFVLLNNGTVELNGDPFTGGGGTFNQSLNTGDSVTFDSVGATTVNVSQINGTNPGDELVIQANNHNWTFDTNGNITFPQGTLLGYSDPGGFIINGAVDKDIAIYTYNGADAHGWTFGTDGTTTFPTGGQIANYPGGVGASNNSWFVTPGGEPDGNGGVSSQDGQQYIQINNNLSVEIGTSYGTANESIWRFGRDGDLTLPEGGDILDSNGDSVLGGGGNANTGNFTFSEDTITNDNGLILSTDRGTLAIGTNMELPGVAGHFHIGFNGSNINPPSSDLFLGDDYNYVKLPGYELNADDFGVEIGSNARDSGSSHVWRFETDGGLKFPDGTTQTTAYTGQTGGSGELYIMANVDGDIVTSTNGIDWTAPQASGMNGIQRVEIHNGVIVYIPGGDMEGAVRGLYYSTEIGTVTLCAGTNISTETDKDLFWQQVHYFAGSDKWVAVGYNDGDTNKSPVLAHSDNGITWTVVFVDNTFVTGFNTEDYDWRLTDVAWLDETNQYVITSFLDGPGATGGIFITEDITVALDGTTHVAIDFNAKSVIPWSVVGFGGPPGYMILLPSVGGANDILSGWGTDPEVYSDSFGLWEQYFIDELGYAPSLTEVAYKNGDVIAVTNDGQVATIEFIGEPSLVISIPLPYTNTVFSISNANPAVITWGMGNVNEANNEKIVVTLAGEYNGTYYVNSSTRVLYTDLAMTTALDASGFAAFTSGTVTFSHGQYFDAAGASNSYYYIGNDDEQVFRSSNGITWTQLADFTGDYFNDFAYGSFGTTSGADSVSYTPDDSGNWNDPTLNTVQAALDELAARVTALQNFEIDGGNAYTPAAGELIIDGNGA
jgi:hypothetical protein